MRKRRHLVKHLVHFRHNVFAIHKDLLRLGRSQSNVKNGAILCDVDLLARKHRFDALP